MSAFLAKMHRFWAKIGKNEGFLSTFGLFSGIVVAG
jgi:hypothetical protein